MASLKLNIIEFGVSIVLLAAFIASFAIASDVAGDWAVLAYIAIIVAYTIAMCLFGWKLAPRMYEQYS